MNFLAHILLSNDQDEIIIGNFIADAVKGNNYKIYSEAIQKGILLHRQIDYFTDTHPTFIQSKTRLREEFGKYAGVVGDIFYDHFLAANWSQFHTTPLNQYSKEIYTLIEKNWSILPPKVHLFFPYMVRGNWLLNYSKVEGIKRTLEGMSRRTINNAPLYLAMDELLKNYKLYESEFFQFFPDVRAFALNYLESMD